MSMSMSPWGTPMQCDAIHHPDDPCCSSDVLHSCLQSRVAGKEINPTDGSGRVPTDERRKISMIFQWYFKTKIPNFPDNSECYKTEKDRAKCYTWAPHTSYDHYRALLRKFAKSSYFIWWMIYQQIMYMLNTYSFTHVVSQNYVCFRIQWFFHEQLIQNSMIFPRIFHFYKFQELFINFNDFSRAVGTLSGLDCGNSSVLSMEI